MKDNIYCHNLRLNLNVQEQLDLHGSLMNFDKQKYKSKNAYMIEVIKAGVEKLSDDFVQSILTDKQMQQLEDRIVERIRKDVLNEVLKTLLRMSARPDVVSVYREQNERQEETQEETIDAGLAAVAWDYFEE